MHWIYAHLIGDYIIQNDWMSLHKKHSSFRCAVHVATYMMPFLWCGMAWWQLALIAVQHYALDRTHFVEWFVRVKGSSGFSTGVCYPWSQIVVDNTLHILWMAWVSHIGIAG